MRQASDPDAQITVEVPQLQLLPRLYSSLCSARCSGPNRAELCLEGHRCSSWTRLLTCPFFQRHVPMAVQTQFKDLVVVVPVVSRSWPRATDHGGNHEVDSVGVQFFLSWVNRAGFSALDRQEFLVIEGSGCGADARS